MSSSEHQESVPAVVQPPSPQPQLPSNLLDSSPELENLDQAAANAAGVVAQESQEPQPPSHHDWLLQRNDQFIDEIWALISERPSASHPDRAQTPAPAPTSLGEPGPAQPSSPYRPPQEPHFQPPGHLRTPRQIAIVDQMAAAVRARARQQEEAERARQAQLPAIAERSANDGVDVHNNGQGQRLRQERLPPYDPYQPTYEWRGQLVNVLPGGNPPEEWSTIPGPTQMPTVPDQPDRLRPSQPSPFPAPPNAGGFQQVRPQELQHQGDSVFNQLMNQLIASGRAESRVYQHIRHRGPIIFGWEYLYHGADIGPDHRLFSCGRGPRPAMREVRNARDGVLVGWEDALARSRGRVVLFHQDRVYPEGSPFGQPFAEQRGRR